MHRDSLLQLALDSCAKNFIALCKMVLPCTTLYKMIPPQKKEKKRKSITLQTNTNAHSHSKFLNFMTSSKGLKLSKIVDFKLVKHCSSQITTPGSCSTIRPWGLNGQKLVSVRFIHIPLLVLDSREFHP